MSTSPDTGTLICSYKFDVFIAKSQQTILESFLLLPVVLMLANAFHNSRLSLGKFILRGEITAVSLIERLYA